MTRNGIVLMSKMVTSAAALRRLYRSARDELDSTRPTRLDVVGVSKESFSTAGKTAVRYMSEMHERNTKKHMWGKVGVYQWVEAILLY